MRPNTRRSLPLVMDENEYPPLEIGERGGRFGRGGRGGQAGRGRRRGGRSPGRNERQPDNVLPNEENENLQQNGVGLQGQGDNENGPAEVPVNIVAAVDQINEQNGDGGVQGHRNAQDPMNAEVDEAIGANDHRNAQDPPNVAIGRVDGGNENGGLQGRGLNNKTQNVNNAQGGRYYARGGKYNFKKRKDQSNENEALKKRIKDLEKHVHEEKKKMEEAKKSEQMKIMNREAVQSQMPSRPDAFVAPGYFQPQPLPNMFSQPPVGMLPVGFTNQTMPFGNQGLANQGIQHPIHPIQQQLAMQQAMNNCLSLSNNSYFQWWNANQNGMPFRRF